MFFGLLFSREKKLLIKPQKKKNSLDKTFKKTSLHLYSMTAYSFTKIWINIFVYSVPLQASVADDDDGKLSGKGAVAAGGFTILSEKKLFLGQKVCFVFPCFCVHVQFNSKQPPLKPMRFNPQVHSDSNTRNRKWIKLPGGENNLNSSPKLQGHGVTTCCLCK